MKTILTRGFFKQLIIILGLGLMTQASVFAEGTGSKQFSNRSIQGTWGFFGTPALIVSPQTGMHSHIVSTGIVSFDGLGNCSVKVTANIDGMKIGPATADSCTYTVEADGTGTSHATFSTPGAPESSSLAFVITDHGQAIRFINTDSIIGSFSATRQ